MKAVVKCQYTYTPGVTLSILRCLIINKLQRIINFRNSFNRSKPF